MLQSTYVLNHIKVSIDKRIERNELTLGVAHSQLKVDSTYQQGKDLLLANTYPKDRTSGFHQFHKLKMESKLRYVPAMLEYLQASKRIRSRLAVVGCHDILWCD